MKRLAVLVAVACLVLFSHPAECSLCSQADWNSCYSACYAPEVVPSNCTVTGVDCLGMDQDTGLLSCQCNLQCQAGGMAGWNDPDHTAGPRHMQLVTGDGPY